MFSRLAPSDPFPSPRTLAMVAFCAFFALGGVLSGQPSDRPSEPAPKVLEPEEARRARPAPAPVEKARKDAGEKQTSHQHLGHIIDQLAQSMDWGGGRHAILIFDPEAKATVLRVNDDLGMAPGGPVKALVGLAALEELGPGFTFSTKLFMEGEIKKKTLQGGLLVVPDGDPTLSTQLADNPDRAYELFDHWAGLLRKRGVKTITGPIRIDERAFDSQREPIGWPAAWIERARLPQVSAANFNDNRMELFWRPGKRAGKVAEYDALPPVTSVYYLSNNVHYVERTRIPVREFRRERAGNLTSVAGKIVLKQSAHDRFAVVDPARFYGEALKSRLIAKKIKVEGPVQVIRPDDWRSDAAAEGKWESAPAIKASDRLVDISGANRKTEEAEQGGTQGGKATEAKGRYIAPETFGEGAAAKISVEASDAPSTASAPVLLDERRSPELGRIVQDMVRLDRDLDAEVLLKTMSRARSGQAGSTAGGIELTQAALRKMRLPATGLILQDGSGVSGVNRVSARLLLNFMLRLPETMNGRQILGALPRSDAAGLLAGRFQPEAPEEGTPAPAVGLVVAIPGETPGGASLAGSVRTLAGRDIQFVIMVNGSKLTAEELRKNIDKIVMEIAASSL